MSRLSVILIFGVFMDFFLFVEGGAVYADSLWQRRATVNYNLFDDNRGKRVGDIVTILVSEETSVDSDESSSTDNKGGHGGEIDNNNILQGIQSALFKGRNAQSDSRSANDYSTNFTQNFSGQGTYDSTRKLEMKLTAVVVEVLDNGNLLLEGRRKVMVNRENYTLKITGIARPIDIAVNNTIPSEKMSNVQFGLEGKGWLSRAGKKGWTYRLKDIFWPF